MNIFVCLAVHRSNHFCIYTHVLFNAHVSRALMQNEKRKREREREKQTARAKSTTTMTATRGAAKAWGAPGRRGAARRQFRTVRPRHVPHRAPFINVRKSIARKKTYVEPME